MNNVLPIEEDLVNDPAGANGGQTAPSSSPPPPGPEPRNAFSRQQALVAMGRRALVSPDLAILLQDAASLVAETLGVEFGCAAELTPDRSRIVHTLTLRSLGSARPRVYVWETGPHEKDSLAGYVLATGSPVAASDLPGDSRFCDLSLREHGIRSALAVPLRLPDQSFGALLACARQQREFDGADALFVEAVAHLVTTTMGRIHAEQTLAQQRRLADEVFQTVEAMVLLVDAEGRIQRVNRAGQEITGYASSELAGRPIFDLFPVPAEADVLRTIFKKLRQGLSPIEAEAQVSTKHSERRPVRWAYTAVPGPQGSIDAIVATGIDLAPLREAEQEAAQAKEAAERARAIGAADSPATPEAPAAASPDTLAAGDDVAARGANTPAGSVTAAPGLAALAGLPSVIQRDRRRRNRLSYPYRQFVAPLVGNRLPLREEFVEVRCNDIAPGGFSFLAAKPPATEMLVVGLGTPPKLTYLTAQVAHVTRVEREGQRAYLVGCSYVGRVDYHQMT